MQEARVLVAEDEEPYLLLQAYGHKLSEPRRPKSNAKRSKRLDQKLRMEWPWTPGEEF